MHDMGSSGLDWIGMSVGLLTAPTRGMRGERISFVHSSFLRQQQASKHIKEGEGKRAFICLYRLQSGDCSSVSATLIRSILVASKGKAVRI